MMFCSKATVFQDLAIVMAVLVTAMKFDAALRA